MCRAEQRVVDFEHWLLFVVYYFISGVSSIGSRYTCNNVVSKRNKLTIQTIQKQRKKNKKILKNILTIKYSCIIL